MKISAKNQPKGRLTSPKRSSKKPLKPLILKQDYVNNRLEKTDQTAQILLKIGLAT